MLVSALALGSARQVSPCLRTLALLHTSAGGDPGLCPIFPHGINFDFDSVTTKMSCHQYSQMTHFGVIVYKSLRLDLFYRFEGACFLDTSL